ncbi:unnamed protein product, partial [Strongylus vulgaris]
MSNFFNSLAQPFSLSPHLGRASLGAGGEGGSAGKNRFYEDTDDNRHFTAALRLGNEQQDAQEFSLVLFDALDRNLPKHPHGSEIRERIRERYS